MSNNYITMNKLRQIVKMYSQSYSKLYIANTVGVARNTVKGYLRNVRLSGMTAGELLAMSDVALNALVKGEPQIRNEQALKELYEYFGTASKKLGRRGVTLLDLWQQYHAEKPEGLSRTTFYRHYALYKRRVRPGGVIEHKSGDKMYIDYAGDKIPYVDVTTGEIKPAEVFVSILAASQLTYVEATESQKTCDLIACCVNAVEYCGGAPLAIVPDNLKAAVVKSSRYEPRLNENFEGFAQHYGMSVVPARAYKPKDKALVENAVKLAYRHIYKHIGEEVLPLAELNKRIAALLEDFNNMKMSGRDYSRREQFEETERSTLQALPHRPYELKMHAKVTVMKNGFIMLNTDKHYYSVPYRFIGKKVKVLYSKSLVEVFYKYEKIAEHARDRNKHKYTTEQEHLASQNRSIQEWNPDKFLQEARSIHPDVELYISQVLIKKPYPEVACRACAGILAFAKRKGNDVLIDACRRAHFIGRHSFGAIEEIILGGLTNLEWEDEPLPEMPAHENVRGDQYYS